MRRFSFERRQRALPEGDLVDASPAEMRVHPVDDDRRVVLRLEREGAFDPEHQGRGSDRRVGIAFGGPRRPLQLDRPGVTRNRFTDDRRPVGDQARLAQAPRGQRLGDQPGSEFSQRAWRRRARASSSLGTEGEGLRHEANRMSANVSALGVRGKAKGDRRANACTGGTATAARSPGARRPAKRPIPIASGSPKCCCSRRPPRRRRPIIRPSSPNGRGSRIWPRPRSRR